jgi:hypothetical protein
VVRLTRNGAYSSFGGTQVARNASATTTMAPLRRDGAGAPEDAPDAGSDGDRAETSNSGFFGVLMSSLPGTTKQDSFP